MAGEFSAIIIPSCEFVFHHLLGKCCSEFRLPSKWIFIRIKIWLWDFPDDNPVLLRGDSELTGENRKNI